MLPALYLLLAPLAAVPADDDPPVRVWLRTDGVYQLGDRVRVYVATADDGYLVVLRADGSGRVRVLFPLDPGDDDYVRGGRDFELRGRGDRDAFFVDDREGTGIVLAAWSRDPFRFDEFVRGDHWDYRTLGPVAADPEAGLLDIVYRMAVGAQVEYDVERYTVRDRYDGGYPSRYRVGVSLSFGYPYYPSFYRPFFYDPLCYPYWSCGGFYFGVGFGYPLGYGYPRFPYGYGYPHHYRPRYGGTVFGRPGHTGAPRFVIPRDRELVRPVEPRRRVADATRDRRSTPTFTVPVRGERGVERSEPRGRPSTEARADRAVGRERGSSSGDRRRAGSVSSEPRGRPQVSGRGSGSGRSSSGGGIARSRGSPVGRRR